MKDLSPEEAGRWMTAAPLVVQNAVTSSATQQVLEQIGKQQALHVDVMELLMKLTSYMLLGYAGPEEFLQELRNVGITDQQSRQIIDEINKKIFVPLREQMRSGAGNTQPVKPTVQTKPVITPRSEPSFTNPTPANPQFPIRPLPPSTQSYGGVRQANASTPRYFHLENKIPVPPTTTAPAVPNNGLASALKQVLHNENRPTPSPEKKLLEDHEEPHINIGVSNKVQGASSPAPLKPYPLPLTPASGIIPPGVRFSPPIVPKVETPDPKPPTPHVPLKPSTLPLTPVSSRPYSTDPYREPIDTP